MATFEHRRLRVGFDSDREGAWIVVDDSAVDDVRRVPYEGDYRSLPSRAADAAALAYLDDLGRDGWRVTIYQGDQEGHHTLRWPFGVYLLVRELP